jgi:hypothetical protein
MPGANAPAASRAKVESTRVSHHRFIGQRRHSLRNGFNGLLRALPGDRAFLSPFPGAIAKQSSPVDTSVEMSGPRGFAVRCAIARHATVPPATAPCPAFVTIASRPSWWDRITRGVAVICPSGQGEIFATVFESEIRISKHMAMSARESRTDGSSSARAPSRYARPLRRLNRDEIKGGHCKGKFVATHD